MPRARAGSASTAATSWPRCSHWPAATPEPRGERHVPCHHARGRLGRCRDRHRPGDPVLTIEDLGILRKVEVDGDAATVTITPTYSGCPAMSQITADVSAALRDAGVGTIRVETTLSPAWTTDWMTEDGKRKLEEYGIAPPTRRSSDGPVPLTLGVPGMPDGLPGM
ncbi:1,2-phenylacetyl-CoA epoxidase subunit PaaD, partial [Corynebacterium variabile]|uniref:1,2-phenylacetyl-CoA epoxidase subunit PaaD n=1 Tax=Corynebacterium variabile TaxID=1727 RepID=UPI0034519B0F